MYIHYRVYDTNARQIFKKKQNKKNNYWRHLCAESLVSKKRCLDAGGAESTAPRSLAEQVAGHMSWTPTPPSPFMNVWRTRFISFSHDFVFFVDSNATKKQTKKKEKKRKKKPNKE